MEKKKLYIGNLAYASREAELEAAFASYGEIEEVRVIIDRATGRSKGFGFVTFKTAEAAQAALEKDGTDLGGRTIRVNVAEDRDPNKPRPSFGGERRTGGFNRDRGPRNFGE